MQVAQLDCDLCLDDNHSAEHACRQGIYITSIPLLMGLTIVLIGMNAFSNFSLVFIPIHLANLMIALLMSKLTSEKIINNFQLSAKARILIFLLLLCSSMTFVFLGGKLDSFEALKNWLFLEAFVPILFSCIFAAIVLLLISKSKYEIRANMLGINVDLVKHLFPLLAGLIVAIFMTLTLLALRIDKIVIMHGFIIFSPLFVFSVAFSVSFVMKIVNKEKEPVYQDSIIDCCSLCCLPKRMKSFFIVAFLLIIYIAVCSILLATTLETYTNPLWLTIFGSILPLLFTCFSIFSSYVFCGIPDPYEYDF